MLQITMTAGKETTANNTICLICDASMGVSTRKCCPIFEQRVSSSDRTIVSVISCILGVNLTEEDVHSNVVCKKCFKTCNEVDELEDRLAELKLELTSSYQRTLKYVGMRIFFCRHSLLITYCFIISQKTVFW